MISDKILSVIAPADAQIEIANKFKALRLAHDYSRKTLSLKSGVSVASIRRFETTGEISLKYLTALAMAVGHLSDFDLLFNPPEVKSLNELRIKSGQDRKRGRK